jgi:tetratricopeptide (TPR) repeat protein
MPRLNWTLALVVLVFGLASPALARVPTDAETISQAAEALGKDPAKAVELVDPVIARSGAMTPDKDTAYSCSDNMADALSSLIGAATPPRKAVVYNSGVCSALFIKGFSLIDLKRGGEAGPFLRRATELAPANSHYLNEYAEWFKTARQWQKSHDLFARAADLAPQQPADVRDLRHARSLRGMGFNLIELGNLDEAEKLMRQSLKLDPESRVARIELQYIAEQRAKAAKR